MDGWLKERERERSGEEDVEVRTKMEVKGEKKRFKQTDSGSVLSLS